MSSSSTPNYTYVAYFIPHDGDSEEHPNLFLIKKRIDEITLADVKASFPLPGTYFFRAKQSYSKTFVWLDVTSDSQRMPKYSDKIMLKVSRMSFEEGAVPSRPPAPVRTTAKGPSTISAARSNSTPAVASGSSPSARPPVRTAGSSQTGRAVPSGTAAAGSQGGRSGTGVGGSSGGGGGGGGGDGDLLGLLDGGDEPSPSSSSNPTYDSDPFSSTAHTVGTPTAAAGPSPGGSSMGGSSSARTPTMAMGHQQGWASPASGMNMQGGGMPGGMHGGMPGAMGGGMPGGMGRGATMPGGMHPMGGMASPAARGGWH